MSKHYGYYGDVWYLYFALLLRSDIEPKRVMKIGVTNARDPMLRLTFKRKDEPYPILNYFPDINWLCIERMRRSGKLKKMKEGLWEW